MHMRPVLQLASLGLLLAVPAAGQTCIALTPLRLAQSVATVRAFPRPLGATQASDLSGMLPTLRTSPGTAETLLRGWVSKGGYTQADRCTLVFALMRAVQTQSMPAPTVSRSAGAAWPTPAATVMAQVEALVSAITALQTDLQQLNAQLKAESQNLKDLLAAKPVAPGAQGTADAVAAYNKAIAEWQARVDATQQRIAVLQATITAKQADLAAKQKELDALQSGLARVIDAAVTAGTV